MSDPKIYIGILICLIIFGVFYFQKKRPPNFLEVSNVFFSSMGLMSSVGLLYTLTTDPSFNKVLNEKAGFDANAFYFGAFAVGWLSLQGIAQMLRSNFLYGTVTEYTEETDCIFLKVVNDNQVYSVVIIKDFIDHILVKSKGADNKVLSEVGLDSIKNKKIIISEPPSDLAQLQEIIICSPKQIIFNYPVAAGSLQASSSINPQSNSSSN
jgi:hypothetical protein